MCGIVGFVGREDCAAYLVKGLRKLEYRGYDSSGIAVGSVDGEGAKLTVFKKAGKLSALEAVLPKTLHGTWGIAHTRWATHGGVTDRNAHPFLSESGRIAIVHNGIIENFTALKSSLIKEGFHFSSETDSEVFAMLIEKYYKKLASEEGALKKGDKKNSGKESFSEKVNSFEKKGKTENEGAEKVYEREGLIGGEGGVSEKGPQNNFVNKGKVLSEAVKMALGDVIGTYALCVASADCPGCLVVAKRGGPAVIGLGQDAFYIASDVSAIVGSATRVIYLEDGDVVEVGLDGLHFASGSNEDYAKRAQDITISESDVQKGGFDTYMEKEITEQDESIERAFAGHIDLEHSSARLGGFNDEVWKGVQSVTLMSAGTSYYAGLVGGALIEKYARVKCISEFSSELRYKNPIVKSGDAFIAISQSGETADTIYALREIVQKGGKVYGVCNVPSSTIARETAGGAFIHAGPEIAVASTKAFSNTLVIFYLLALKLGRERALSRDEGDAFIREILALPRRVEGIIAKKGQIEALAKKYYKSDNFLFLGRGILYPIALEGALKLKEISYIHSEAFAAGEIKHGPIALVNEETPSVFLVGEGVLREKTISNIKEVKARRGRVIVIGVEGDEEVKNIADDFIGVEKCQNSDFYTIPFAVVCQLFAFYCAKLKGCDVDQPRNLAKSVTVE